jgi:hypothetical protein
MPAKHILGQVLDFSDYLVIAHYFQGLLDCLLIYEHVSVVALLRLVFVN